MGEPQHDSADRPTGAGFARRIALAELATRHVLPIWERGYPRDQRPYELLDIAQRLVRGEASHEEAERAWSDLAGDLQDPPDSDPAAGKFLAELMKPQHAGMAAVRTVVAAMYDVDVDPDLDHEDHELDVEQWDASYRASLAECGYNPGDPPYEEGDSGDNAETQERRRQFWRWYLDEAVPAAYRSAN
jgi:hypothetical protein